jgi:hypothetical protein
MVYTTFKNRNICFIIKEKKGMMDLLNDRGFKKWKGFFMPEYVKQLKDLRHDYYKTPRPQLVEGQIEEMEALIRKSGN